MTTTIPMGFVDRDPALAHEGGVILEQLRPAEGREAEFCDWYLSDYLQQIVRLPGVKSGAFLMGQMMPTRPDYHFVGIYRINGTDAAASWRDAPRRLFAPGLLTPTGIAITHWDRVTDQITKDAVQHPSATALGQEERARAVMGDRVQTGGAEKLGSSSPRNDALSDCGHQKQCPLIPMIAV